MPPEPELTTREPPTAEGIRVAPSGDGPAAFLWAYEWTMFGALQEPPHLHRRAAVPCRRRRPAGDGRYRRRNPLGGGRGGRCGPLAVGRDPHRPRLAAVVPCPSPGQEDDQPVTGCLADEGHEPPTTTASRGSSDVDEREIHYLQSVPDRVRERYEADFLDD